MRDSKNLKALCEAAPTGPWLVENDSVYFKDDGYTRHLLDADAGHDVEDEAYYAALKFIAAANPAAVLDLLNEIATLKAGGQLLVQDRNEAWIQRDQLRAEVASLKAGYEAYEQVNAELKADVEVFRRLLGEMRAIGNHAPAGLTLRIDAAMGKGERS